MSPSCVKGVESYTHGGCWTTTTGFKGGCMRVKEKEIENE